MKTFPIKVLSFTGILILLGVISFILYKQIFDNSDINHSAADPISDDIVITENGLQLTATFSDIHLTPDDELNIQVEVKNISDEMLSYYGYCGIPINIFHEKDDKTVWLKTKGEEQGCPDIYDPNAVKEFKPNEILQKEMTFYPLVSFSNSEVTDAPEGMYHFLISFQTEEGNKVEVNKTIEVADTNPSIITVDEAIDRAKSHPKVINWIQENESVGIVEEEHFLSDTMWVIMFHTSNYRIDSLEPIGDRLVVHVDAKNGDILNVFNENFE